MRRDPRFRHYALRLARRIAMSSRIGIDLTDGTSSCLELDPEVATLADRRRVRTTPIPAPLVERTDKPDLRGLVADAAREALARTFRN